jgi:hypothetical protein
MPTLAVVRCFLCDRLAEVPHWQRVALDRTDTDEVFTFDVPLCLACEERTRPAGRQGEAFAAQESDD